MNDYLKATDVAKLCSCDLKTVHNWCDKDKLPHFRTPGRHLRFKAADVVPFLEKYGYPVPDALRKRATEESAAAASDG